MPIEFTAAAEGAVPTRADAVGVPVHDNLRAAVGGVADIDTRFLRKQGFEGKVGQAVPLLADDGSMVVAVGLGPVGSVDAEAVRRAAAAFAKAAWRARRGAFVVPPVAGLEADAAAQAAVEGIGLKAYRFDLYKSSSTPCELRTVAIVGGTDDGVRRGIAAVRAATFARDLINEPASAMPPARLADAARVVAEEAGLSVRILDEAAIEAENLGGLVGVSRGSVQPPRLIRLEWAPAEPKATVVLVGKGITFDSGGLSLKTYEGMLHMKNDMSGGAAVIAAMTAVRDVAPDVRVVAIVPATENMPSGRAVKPGDVLRFRNGKTAEILNTDAEGRLVLADGLSLAAELLPDAIIDLATLTGACVVALGREISGVMGNDDGLVGRVLAASERSGEAMWQLPLDKRYRKLIDSEVADMKNVGAPGSPGALIAALFLAEFVGDVPWVHLDIAGPSWSESDEGYVAKGGTGVGVRTLLELLADFQAA
jgi:leucyl aminopeptidase